MQRSIDCLFITPEHPMYNRHPFRPLFSLSAAALVLGGSFGLTQKPLMAQAGLNLNLPGLSAPGNRQSGSTRSETCVAADAPLQLTALMPESNYGQTIDAYPSFFFYLPETDAEAVKFVVYNETTNALFYEGEFSPQGKSGIFSLDIPDNGVQKALELGESYYWYLSIACDIEDPSANIVVGGTVARVAASEAVEEALATATPEQLPGIYASAGLWHDALAASAQLAQDTSDSVAWSALLTAIDLQHLLEIPVLSDKVTLEPEAGPVIDPS
ncbi:MAG: DUF928 domain-containing protein [Leptolyngbya sp. RL_3_1]|nr:DUF928 domain-containing protein [Leptolyngbya sp. RL_3_1]